jgi:antitoxin (DNA-binding transcriptional repressor) of toxin-antitoxin stability system
MADDQHGHLGYGCGMRTVNISDLKAQLSGPYSFVRDGEEVLVGGRNKPVARIVPCRLQGHSEEAQRLVAHGVLTPPLQSGLCLCHGRSRREIFLMKAWGRYGGKKG